jgi:hypothetical protein
MILGKLRGDIRAAAVGVTFRWYFILKYNFPPYVTLMCNFPMKLIALRSLFLNKHSCNIFMIFVFFTLPFDGRVPTSPLSSYNINFVQHGITESAAFKECVCGIARRYTELVTYLEYA